MKIIHLISLACPFIALSFSGCVSTMSLEEGRIAVSDQLQIPQESIQFLNYCEYGFGHVSDKTMESRKGLVVITNDAIHVAEGSLGNLDVKKAVRLDLQDIRSVEYSDNNYIEQVQIIRNSQLLVIEVKKYGSLRFNRELNQELYYMLAHSGIPIASRNQYVGIHEKYDPPDGRSMADLAGPTNLDR